jgi:hypothetical protein
MSVRAREVSQIGTAASVRLVGTVLFLNQRGSEPEAQELPVTKIRVLSTAKETNDDHARTDEDQVRLFADLVDV